tara:strand:- start:1092 stop:1373 length:282 start_codon:yes stop_codon:yes gene_type:complete
MSFLPECAQKCNKLNVECPNNSCRMWIDYGQDKNCCLISIEEKGKDGSDKGLTLHEVADRLKINYLKVRQIEINAIRKLSTRRELKNAVKGEG